MDKNKIQMQALQSIKESGMLEALIGVYASKLGISQDDARKVIDRKVNTNLESIVNLFDTNVTSESIKNNITNNHFQLIDARSSGRFLGKELEPRKNLKSGHIQNSINLPWNECIDSETKCFLEKKVLEKKFKTLKIDLTKPVVFSCGSGVTACIIGKAFNIVTDGTVCVYDGSWTEWATKEQLFT